MSILLRPSLRPVLRKLTTKAAQKSLHEVLLIYDKYDGSVGSDLNGRAPDTINAPGNSWVATVDGPELDGSGGLVFDDSDQVGYIDTGVTDNICKAEEGADSISRAQVGILLDASVSTSDGLWAVRVGTQILIDQYVGGVRTILYNEAGHFADNGFHTIAIEYDGSNLKLYTDGSVVGAATQENYSIPAGLSGNSFAGTATGPFGTPSSGFRSHFKFWDLR